jgi:hypothetical protein
LAACFACWQTNLSQIFFWQEVTSLHGQQQHVIEVAAILGAVCNNLYWRWKNIK